LAKSLSLTTTNLLHINVDLWLRGLGWWKLQHLQCGDFIVKEPMVVGHECAGIVEESGKDVEHLVVGIALLWSLGFLVTIVMNAKRVLTTYVPT